MLPVETPPGTVGIFISMMVLVSGKQHDCSVDSIGKRRQSCLWQDSSADEQHGKETSSLPVTRQLSRCNEI